MEAVARKVKSWTMLYLYVCIVSISFTCVPTALATTTATRRSTSNVFDKRSIKFRTCSTLFGTFLCRPCMITKSNARYENRVAHPDEILIAQGTSRDLQLLSSTELLLLDKLRQGSTWVACRKTILLTVNLGGWTKDLCTSVELSNLQIAHSRLQDSV